MEARGLIELYGIANCDTMKKARAWLGERGIACAFHDYKRDGVPAALLDGWLERVGWEALLNRAGTTFRKLPEETRADLDKARARAIMLAHPAAIKRPVLVADGRLEIGFKPERYAALFD